MSDTTADKPATSFSRRVPEGDQLERAVCDTCGFIAYENPKIVVGTVVHHEGRILMCRRAIEPRHGFWTLPAGFMELGETVEQAAMREAQEEALADIVIDGLLAVYSVPRISQVQVMFRGHLRKPDFSPGPESLDVKLVAFDEIPWTELAFPTVRWALLHDRQIAEGRGIAPFSNPPADDADFAWR
jgi:ADP-ribose pyrophosphatase YjhB (NUDIX family)